MANNNRSPSKHGAELDYDAYAREYKRNGMRDRWLSGIDEIPIKQRGEADPLRDPWYPSPRMCKFEYEKTLGEWRQQRIDVQKRRMIRELVERSLITPSAEDVAWLRQANVTGGTMPPPPQPPSDDDDVSPDGAPPLSQLRRKRSVIGDLPSYVEPDKEQERKKFEEERDNSRRVRRRTNVLALQSLGEATSVAETRSKEKPRKSVHARIMEAEQQPVQNAATAEPKAPDAVGNDKFGGQGPAAVIVLDDSQQPTVPPPDAIPSLESEAQPVDAPLDNGSEPLLASGGGAPAKADPKTEKVDAVAVPPPAPAVVQEEKKQKRAIVRLHFLAEQKANYEQQLVILSCQLGAAYRRLPDKGGCVCQAGEIRTLLTHLTAMSDAYTHCIRTGLLGEELD